MPQLQLNQGAQDALLYDNTRSYFTNVGYARTSNFQLELRDVDAQNNVALGSTVQFIIPKAADLLGPVDLMVDFKAATGGATADAYAAWVEALGYAMIDKITFSVGSHDVESITGEQLNIINELMKSDEARFGKDTILKTGSPSIIFEPSDSDATVGVLGDVTSNTGRIIYQGNSYNESPAKLIVPLGLFFTKHPGNYFPLAAIAGCNDVRISIKFHNLEDLLILGATKYVSGASTDIQITNAAPISGTGSSAAATVPGKPTWSSGVIDKCKLRCHYIHVTGPEATTLMNKEHVRLLKLWQVNTKTFKKGTQSTSGKLIDMDLSFLHPIQELIITIRKTDEMGSTTTVSQKPEIHAMGAFIKNYFAYQGGGKDPNIESLVNKCKKGAANVPDASSATVLVDNIKLTLNGQERHPGLSGVDRNYLMNRLMPMLHSNTSTHFDTDGLVVDDSELDFRKLGHMLDRKEIYAYPFCLNPEGANPSGAVNFSKVSHAKLQIDGTTTLDVATECEYQVDVYGVYYNWLQIKDGRALTSFA